jgi:hypothetical protein
MAVGWALNGVNQEQRQHAMYMRQREAEMNARQPAMGPVDGEDFRAQMNAQAEARRKLHQEILEGEMEASRSNWRPLVSYTGNLSRIGQELLNTDGAWKKLSKYYAPDDPDRFLLNSLGPQYPWYWSAGVLAVLFGLSLCILNFRVRSMDRLR